MILLMEGENMRTKIEIIPENETEELVIRCHKMTDELQEIINHIDLQKKVIGYKRVLYILLVIKIFIILKL